MPLEIWRRFWPALAVVLACFGPAAADTLSEAEAALLTGDLGTARTLAGQLLQENPADARAKLVLGQAQLAGGDAVQARAIATEVYRASAERSLRYAAARLAARATYAERRFTATTWWLRRAADLTEDTRELAAIAEGLQIVRAESPYRTNVAFGLAPSSNINGGASGEVLVINGIPTFLDFSEDARALSGIEASLDLSQGFRIWQGDNGSDAWATVRLRSATYALSAEAEDRLAADGDTTDGADFASTVIEGSLRTTRNLDRGALSLGATVGHNWYGGKAQGWSLRLDATRFVPIRPKYSLRLGVSAERTADDLGMSLRISDLRNWPTGRLESTVTLTRFDGSGGDWQGATVALGWTAAEPIAGLDLRVDAAVSYRDYAVYFLASDGRQDRRATLSATVGLPALSRLGFMPEVTVSGSRQWSNVSRFETREIGVGIGVVSRF